MKLIQTFYIDRRDKKIEIKMTFRVDVKLFLKWAAIFTLYSGEEQIYLHR